MDADKKLITRKDRPWWRQAPVVLFLVVLSNLLASTTTQAQNLDPAERAAREHEQRLKQEELRREEEWRRNRQDPDIFLQPDQLDDDAWVGDDQARCFDIREIQVHGVTQFTDEKIAAITDPYRNQCLGIREFNEIVKQLSNLYMQKGYVTSRAYIQPQNLKSGLLEVLVVEGQLESLLPVDDAELSARQLRWAFPAQDNEILSLRDLEQGLENLNRLRQNNASMDLTPGEQPGYTRVMVSNLGSRWLSGGFSLNNSGSKATGETLGTVHASWDNLTRSNDNVYLSFSHALDAPSVAKSESYVFNYTIPYGYFLYRLSASSFNYQQLVQGSAVDFVTSGSSASQSLSIDYLVYRGQRDKLTVASSLTRKDSKNYLEDVFLETSSRTLYLAKLGVKYTRNISKGTLRAGFDWSRSESWFDATEKLVAAELDFQFDKYTADLSWSRSLFSSRSGWNFQTNLSLFYTPDDIIASEALSLGSQYTVRGFEGAGLIGYSGGYWRNEISKQLPLFKQRQLTFTAGLDIGSTDTPEYVDQNREWLSGAVFSLAYYSRRFSLDVTYAQGIKSPDYIPFDESSVYASLQINI